MQAAMKIKTLDGIREKEPRHRAVYRFETAEVASAAVRSLHGQFMLNNPVSMRVIHG